LQALADASRELSRGNLGAQVEASAPGEIGELAERFNEMAKQLQVFDRLKDQFVSNVSHELRSPLAAIAMNADYLLEQDPERVKLGAKQREMLTAIQDCAVRLAVQVNTVLDAAKLRAGKMEYKLAPVALNDAAHRAVALFSVAAGSVGVTLLSEIPAGLPRVIADSERVDAILSNLIWNGLKYTPSGGRVTLQAKASDGMIELAVADTGRGIAKEEQERLFAPFQRADEADQERRRLRGTGLGLFIVKLTVEGMGGRVRMESEPGRGTCVSLTLPVEKPS